jgi:hypothetical protein
VTKICESFAGGFAQVGRTLDRPSQPIKGLLRMQKSGKVVKIYGRFGPEYKQFGSLCAICAIYASGAMPHKHWLFRILLIWQVGT